MTDAMRLIRKLGRGAVATSLGLATTSDGYVDARNLRLPSVETTGHIHTPVGDLGTTRDFAVFRRLHLRKVDLSGSRIADSLWFNCRLEDVRLDGADARLIAFSRGRLERVSFRRTNLSASAWGMTGRGGPLVSGCSFIGSDLTQSAYNHPLFRNCHFDTFLKDVSFDGARFENCTFAGTLRDVTFDRTYDDPNPFVSRLVNEMRNVDFSRARMVSVSFAGVDLSSVTLPATDHVLIHRPRAVFERSLHRVDGEWTGKAREEAKTFLEVQLGGRIRVPDTEFVFSPQDFLGGSLSPQVAERLLQELETANEELSPGRSAPSQNPPDGKR